MKIKNYRYKGAYPRILLFWMILLGYSAMVQSQPLSLPIQSAQFTPYYSQAPKVYAFYLNPDYQEKTMPFTAQERSIPIQGDHFGLNRLPPNIRYLDLGEFEREGYRYKLIIYNRDDDADILLLNIQINSYDEAGHLIDALLLDSRYAFESIERFSTFKIEQDAINIDYFVTHRTESLENGDMGKKIENPMPQIYMKAHYKFDKGIFRLHSLQKYQ